MKSKLIVITVLILCDRSTFDVSAQQDSSILLNNRGYELYKVKEYHRAVELFNQAINKNYSNYIAYYNLASTYSILTTLGVDCNTNFYAKTIHALEACYHLDSLKTKQKAHKDKDFDGIRNEYEFNVLIYGLKFEKPEHVKGFIVEKTFRTSIPGSTYYPIEELTINNDNTWFYSFHKNAEEMIEYWHGEQKGETPKLVCGTKAGIWHLDGHILRLIDQSNTEFEKFILKKPGIIGNLYYPNPNDMSGENIVRHYWKCGKCGCNEIDKL